MVGFTFTVMGRTYAMRQQVTEPEPGRVLRESTIGRDQVTTFTVTPTGAGSHVRIETIWQPRRGPAGVAARLFAPRMLRALYAEELEEPESVRTRADGGSMPHGRRPASVSGSGASLVPNTRATDAVARATAR